MILLSDNEVIQEIKSYSNPNWIWIEIWERSQYEVRVVVSVNEEEACHLGQNKVIYIYSAQTKSNCDEIGELKAYGRKITRLIRKHFPYSEVHSRLYYK